MSKSDEIKEALEKVTPGPWNAPFEQWPGNNNLQYWIQNHDDGIACAAKYKDAHLIANAPEWLQYLLQENQRYQEALETMAESEDDWYVGRTTMKEFASQALKKEGE